MRLVINILILLMLAAVSLPAYQWWDKSREQAKRVESTIESIDAIREKIRYETAIITAFESALGYPDIVDPKWFGRSPPGNRLLEPDAQWLDRAPEGDYEDHPPDPIHLSHQQGGFWYNPANGLLRARIPDQGSESANLKLYNQVNGTDLTSLGRNDRMARTPILQEGVERPAPEVVNVRRTEPLNGPPPPAPTPTPSRQPSSPTWQTVSPAPAETESEPEQAQPRNRRNLRSPLY